MSAITTSRFELNKLPDYLQNLFDEFSHSSFELRNEAVQAGAEAFKTILENNSPKNTGEYAKNWVIKERIPNRRYIGNKTVAHGAIHRKGKNGKKGEAKTGVPLSNVLEYSEKSPYRGMIRSLFDSNESKIFEVIKKTMENGGKNSGK